MEYYILIYDNNKYSNFKLEYNTTYKCDIKLCKTYDENLKVSITYILDHITPIKVKECELKLSQNYYCNHHLTIFSIDNILKNIMNYISMSLGEMIHIKNLKNVKILYEQTTFQYDEYHHTFAIFKIVDIPDVKMLDLIILNYGESGPFRKINNAYYFEIELKRMRYENITDNIEQITNLNNDDSRCKMFLKLIKHDTYYMCNLENLNKKLNEKLVK